MARVLVVDDALFMRRVVSDAVAAGAMRWSVKPPTASRRVGAVHGAAARRDDARHHDAEKDGLTALREIIAPGPGARVVMCSALGQKARCSRR